MRKISIYILSVILLAFTGCEDFLDSENYVGKDTSNFPKTVAEANELLVSAYGIMNENLHNNDIVGSLYYISEMASDDRFGGGGDDDKTTQAIDRLQNYGTDLFRPLWKTRYKGIYRTNYLLESMDIIQDWPKKEEDKILLQNKIMGQAHFLRGLYFFDLSQVFGNVPLTLKTTKENLPKTPAEDTYAQIAFDLKTAIELLPADKYNAAESGRATKWAAQALMARVFLFYTGYYKKDALPLPEGGSVTKTEVIAWLKDCKDSGKSGHGLATQDYRNLFSYTNEFTKPDYPISNTNNLKWVGDGNIETIFALKFNNLVDWGDLYGTGYSNRYSLFFGLRATESHGEASTFPLGKGWGLGTVNPNFYTEWKVAEPNDKRRDATISDISVELPGYNYGAQRHMEETGYVQKKYMPINAYDDKRKITQFDNLLTGVSLDYQISSRQDFVMIRYSDVLLMYSELTGTADDMNTLRSRAGLADVGYSLKAIQNERRWELAFEGLRWFDLLRWGIASEAIAKQEGANIKNNNIATSMKHLGVGYSQRLQETGGFWAIPIGQIQLSAGVLEQNPGWKGDKSSEFGGWK